MTMTKQALSNAAKKAWQTRRRMAREAEKAKASRKTSREAKKAAA